MQNDGRTNVCAKQFMPAAIKYYTSRGPLYLPYLSYSHVPEWEGANPK